MTFWEQIVHFFVFSLYLCVLLVFFVVCIYALTDQVIRVVVAYFAENTKFLLAVTVEEEEVQHEVDSVVSTLKN